MSEQHYRIDLDAVTTREKQALTHNIHPYPAKYIPQIPGSLLDYLDLPSRSTVLDPFCGSGTTLLEAAIRGHNAVGVDSNPIAALISRAKCTPLSPEQRALVATVLDRLSLYAPERELPTVIPDFLNRSHWFQANMQRELGYIKGLIQTVSDPQAADFLNTAFSAIIVKASNQESDTRWRAKDKHLPDGFAIAEFGKRARDMLARLRQLEPYQLGSVTVKTQDSRCLDFMEDDSVQCAITSPPYMNSYDYYLYHKLRMYWLGYNHYEVQETEIGSRNKHCDHGGGTQLYVDSISQVAQQVHQKLAPAGRLCVVIGDSIYRGELIHMDRVYRAIAQRTGFSIQEVFSFDQRKYTRAFTPNLKTAEKKSHIMIFQKV
ncbi:MAG: hypothetical protein HFF19_01615 [Oscillospiraceae bacterium]|jgi:DNA modification methylase|nr:hypothetical protein [Oscillospiraceae bacterium]